MTPEAIDKARIKLDRMRHAASRLQLSASHDDLEGAWEDFLTHASTFFSAIEQGSKATQPDKNWFGPKKHERRTDPLLSYIHHARDAEQHGLGRITKRSNSNIVVHPGASVALRSDGKNWQVDNPMGRIDYPNDRINLVTVHDDRYHDSFDPPDAHLGIPITDHSPANIATLAVAYFESLFVEAEARSA
jgi:hypothetical protein